GFFRRALADASSGLLVLSSRYPILPGRERICLLRRPEPRPALVLYVLGDAGVDAVVGPGGAGGLSLGAYCHLRLERHPKMSRQFLFGGAGMAGQPGNKLALARGRDRRAPRVGSFSTGHRNRCWRRPLAAPVAMGGYRRRGHGSFAGAAVPRAIGSQLQLG